MVEDSLTERVFLKSILESDPEIEVVGMIANGLEAVEAAKELKPDLITMDIQLPGMNGIEATRQIMQQAPTRIVVFARGDLGGDDQAFQALEAGALDVLTKPMGMGPGQLVQLRERLLNTIKLMAVVKVVRRHAPRERRRPDPAEVSPPSIRSGAGGNAASLVAIGASTGGPAALHRLLTSLPSDFAAPVVVVQHISSGFTNNLVDWLRKDSPLPIDIAQAHQNLTPGHVYFAPEDVHLVVVARDQLGLRPGPPVSAVRPSVTVLFRSVARIYGADAAAVLLTGIGDDGAEGLKAIQDRGGTTIAQDEKTSVVYGMPKAAVALGAATNVLPLEDIAPALVHLTNGKIA